MSFNPTLIVLVALSGLAAASDGYVPIASPIYSPTHSSDGSSVRRDSKTKRRAVVDTREKDTVVQSANNPTSSPAPKARFSSPTPPPAEYPPLEASANEANKTEEAALPDTNARYNSEINVVNRSCDVDYLQEWIEEVEAQVPVNTTEELGAPVDFDARNDLVINDTEELKAIVAGGAIAETTVETAESAHAKIAETPAPSPAPKDMFTSPTLPVDIQESSGFSRSAQEGSVNEAVHAPIGLEVEKSNRTDDNERCSGEYPFEEASHFGAASEAKEDLRSIATTDARY